ncbi:MAG: hypothetical protein H6714_10565 [Myxococcales bacterium]|nr:hypothetical protein [Myxococcales bacterium]
MRLRWLISAAMCGCVTGLGLGCQTSAAIERSSERQGHQEPPLVPLPAPTQSYVLNAQGQLFAREVLNEVRVFGTYGEWIQVGLTPARFIKPQALPRAISPPMISADRGRVHHCPFYELRGARLNKTAQYATGVLDVFGIYNDFAQVGYGAPLGWVSSPCVTLEDTPLAESSAATPASSQSGPPRPKAVQEALADWTSISEWEREARLIQLTHGSYEGLEDRVYYPATDPWHYSACGNLQFHRWDGPGGVVNESADLSARDLGVDDFIRNLRGEITLVYASDSDVPVEVNQFTSHLRSQSASSIDYYPEGEGSLCRLLYRFAICVQSKAPNVTHMTHTGMTANAGLRAKYTNNYGKPLVTYNTKAWTIPLNPFICEDGLSGRSGSVYRLYWAPRGWE